MSPSSPSVLAPDTAAVTISTYAARAGFTLAMSVGHHAAVRLVPGARRIGLVVAHDAQPGSPLADDLAIRVPSASTTVWAHDDGSVLVRATFAPPALLVPADQGLPVAMVPQVPGDPGQVHLAPGDRLLVLTAAAFDQAPQVVARLVRGDDVSAADRRHLRGLRMEPDEALLRRFLRHAPSAGGAVLTRACVTPGNPPPLSLHTTDRRTR
ncbi:hypothetical protein V3N99_15205 [Dermatophilaceae bacterium Soc4.6]